MVNGENKNSVEEQICNSTSNIYDISDVNGDLPLVGVSPEVSVKGPIDLSSNNVKSFEVDENM